MLEAVLSSCRAAVGLGLRPKDLQELSVIAPGLASDFRFTEILEGDPPLVSAVPTKLLVDVYPDIRTRLVQVDR
jgi:hypothetical protein